MVVSSTKFTTERKILYVVSTWDEDVTTLKDDLVTGLENLYHYDKDSGKLSISDGLVSSAMACHLRPEKRSKANRKCKLCSVNDTLMKYESRIFNTTQRKNDDVEVTTISNKGNWKPTPEELVLKGRHFINITSKCILVYVFSVVEHCKCKTCRKEALGRGYDIYGMDPCKEKGVQGT